MNYVDNDKFLKEIKIYESTGVQTEELGRMVLLIAQNYSAKGSFAGYSYKDDMVCEAVLTCLKYIHNFDVETEDANPFAYFSRVIHNAFLNYISKQKKHSSIKDICYKNIDFLIKDPIEASPMSYFDVSGIDYQVIRGNKKKKRKKRSVPVTT